MNSCLYRGHVRHRRFVQKANHFSYQVVMVCLDLDELDTVFNDFWFWSVERSNIASFKRKAYFGNPECSLKESVLSLLAENSRPIPERIYLLTNLTYYGYCINPISLYLCQIDGKLSSIVLEVTNTPWGEKKCYVLNPEPISEYVYRVKFNKDLHVSPFLSMNYHYALTMKLSSSHFVCHIENWQDNSKHFDATLSLRVLQINHVNLSKTLIQYPWMTMKVVLAIYWQALKIWLKGNAYIPHP